MEKVVSHSDFLSRSAGTGKSFLLLYKAGNQQSDCALKNIDNTEARPDARIYYADVTSVRDIHQAYGIESVPALMVFTKGKLTSIIKGCHESGYYQALFGNALFTAGSTQGEKPGRRVTVYSTPTCSWCNTLKSWLRKNNVSYTDIDVSADQTAAEALVRRSGQQGVPQTDIDGQIVVGFDQQRLKQLLEIQ